MKCPEIRVFDDYFSGLLTSKERAELEEHLKACPDCKVFFDSEKQLEGMLRKEQVQKAPIDLHRRVMQQIAELETSRGLPDWFMALAFGLVVSFVGLMVGKLSGPLLDFISQQAAVFQSHFINLEILNSITQSKLYMSLTGGSPILLLNFLVAGTVACWGLWQMVKALRN